ncbi:unnamed protein product, partial [Brenthis ino]
MIIFKCALIILSSTYILSLCSQVVTQTNFFDTGLAFMYVASGALAGKIIYDRYQQIHILGSLTPNPNVTSFANRISCFSASFLSLGFLVYYFLFLFKVDEQCLRALNIFICGFGTLYMWVQCIITTYICTLFFDKRLTVLRQCLANVSFPILVVMAIFGTVSSFLPEDGTRGVYVCHVVSSLCSYILTGIFCIFLLSFEKDYEYFSEGLRTELLLDDGCSLNNASLSDVDSIFENREPISNTIVIARSIACVDNDSGMSSGENDESMRYVYNKVSDTVANSEKCLTNDNQRAVLWNEIPSCSNVNINVSGGSDVIDSNFIVINVYDSDSDSVKYEAVGRNVYEDTTLSDESKSLVPVRNEIVKSESQKLVSLSLSILLAALLQAMRCFAQFLEDIVTPQRL